MNDSSKPIRTVNIMLIITILEYLIVNEAGRTSLYIPSFVHGAKVKTLQEFSTHQRMSKQAIRWTFEI